MGVKSLCPGCKLTFPSQYLILKIDFRDSFHLIKKKYGNSCQQSMVKEAETTVIEYRNKNHSSALISLKLFEK